MVASAALAPHQHSAATTLYTSDVLIAEQPVDALKLAARKMASTTSSSPAAATQLLNGMNGTIPQISPNVVALRKINQTLSVSPAISASSSSGGTAEEAQPSPATNRAAIQLAEDLKSQLEMALQKMEAEYSQFIEISNRIGQICEKVPLRSVENFAEVRQIVGELESARLTNDALEVSRIGLAVNNLRRAIAETHPDLAKQCRQLIKTWRSKMVDGSSGSSRPTSSCGSSTTTPALISPAVRRAASRGLTPAGGKITPTAQLSIDASGTSGSYAPTANKISPQVPLQHGTKRTHPSDVSPSAVAAKRTKISPALSDASATTVKTPTPPLSVVAAARKNVQSTEELVAALGMESLLKSSTPTSVSPPEKLIMPPLASSPERKRRKRSPKKGASEDSQTAPVVPRITIKFGGKPSEPRVVVGTGAPAPDASATKEAEPSKPAKKESRKPKEVKPVVPAKPAFSWYDNLPSIEELDRRAEEQKKNRIVEPDLPEQAADIGHITYRNRRIVLMPYVDDDEHDFLMGLAPPKYAGIF